MVFDPFGGVFNGKRFPENMTMAIAQHGNNDMLFFFSTIPRTLKPKRKKELKSTIMPNWSENTLPISSLKTKSSLN